MRPIEHSLKAKHAAESRAGKLRVLQIRETQVRFREVQVPQIDPTKVRAGEVDLEGLSPCANGRKGLSHRIFKGIYQQTVHGRLMCNLEVGEEDHEHLLMILL